MSTASLERSSHLAAYDQVIAGRSLQQGRTLAGAGKRELDAKAIADLALTKLLATLARHGNQIGTTHRQALADLVGGLANQMTRAHIGRSGYPLTCGAGKTQALVAVLSATHELGLGYSVVVAAQKVTDLVKIRRDLRVEGVAPEVVGLLHSRTAREPLRELKDESPPVTEEDSTSTGEADRQFLLATHEMLRQGGRRELVTRHRGQQRDLMVWDETLLMSKAGAIVIHDIETAAFHFGSSQPIATSFLDRVTRSAKEDMARQGNAIPPTPFVIDCSSDERKALEAVAGRRFTSFSQTSAATEILSNVLSLVGQSVAVAQSEGTGKAIIHYEVVIDPDFDNIAVLDASHVVRLLGQLGVKEATSAAMRACKRYDDCTATLYKTAASKHAQRSQRFPKTLAELVARIIASISQDESAVIFAFKATRSTLENELSAAGIDLRAELNGKPRIVIETWGNETGTNRYSHCRHVILVGVLRQDRARLMAQWSGELDDLTKHPDAERLRQIELSEMVSCVLQALSRGQSRLSRLGLGGESQAHAQSVHIIDSDAERIAEVLRSSGCLPGMNWVLGDTGKTDSLTMQVAKVIGAVLAGLPLEQADISTRKLKELALGAGAPKVIPKTFTAALEEACHTSAWSETQTWLREGRSVRRVVCKGLEALDLRRVRSLRN